MAEKARCFVTSSDEGQGAFGIRADTDENVYIPFRMAEAMALEEFDEIEVVVVKNDRPEPAWRAIKARRVEG
jgi:hypothetical protein